MRSGLFWKLFLLQVLAAAAVIGGALATSRSFSERGFAEFIQSRERERVQDVAAQIAQKYRESGDLGVAAEGLLRERRLYRFRDPGEAPQPAPPPDERPPEEREAEPRPRDRIPPLQLQDEQGAYVRGDRRELALPRLREPIVIDGKTVGYLAWRQIPTRPEQVEFAHKQAQHLAVIAPIALVVAAAFAWLITALITRPIRALSRGASALARREFTTRLPEHSNDELGALAADFNRLAAALEGYDARQRQWLADISHELRTPVAVLRGEIEAVLDGVRPASVEGTRSLQHEVARLEALIGDLHLVSLAEAGALRLHRTASDVGELVREAGARFRERLAAAGFQFRVETGSGLVADLDPQRFEQALANLLENVLRHARAPGPVELTARMDGADVVVTVADAGPGVPDPELPRLFDRLHRMDAARSRSSGGAGLGLAIVKSIVEAHGGSVSATRSASGGLEVALRVPRA